MIVTMTPNPSVDRTLFLDTVGAGDAFLQGYLAADANALDTADRLALGLALGRDSSPTQGHAVGSGR
jgi:fructose-1-phosphate kinase PfkB-like protein